MYASLDTSSDPFLTSYFGFTPNADGSLTSQSSGVTTTPGFDTGTLVAAADTTPARGGCPASWPDWACSAINNIGGLFPGLAETPTNRANINKNITKPLTGKDNGTTDDIVPHLASQIPSYLIMSGVILMAVVLLGLGVWTIVKD